MHSSIYAYSKKKLLFLKIYLLSGSALFHSARIPNQFVAPPYKFIFAGNLSECSYFCFYLLIGFWFTWPIAMNACQKAALVTNRAGHFGMFLGILGCF